FRGPLTEPLLTGGAVAEEGALQFADLVTKRVIDLDDPANAVFVDSTTLRKRKLGSDLRTRLVQALRIEDLHLVVGESFWLRSNEANIKLTGDVQVNKAGRTYRVDGTMQAERGRYAVFTKDFDVIRGDVRFFGTPDLNAGLDIEAQHVVRTTRNEELPIVARVTGTLLAPKLQLGTTARTNIPDADLFSYLIAGRPASEVGANYLTSAGMAYALGLASNELERALISDLGVPIDMLQIRPLASTGPGDAGALALSAGWQLSTRTFLSLNAGFCPNSLASFDYRNIGAALEYRFSQSWKAQVVMEPVLRFCGVTNLGANVASSQLYQFGVDVLWQREF
ncbi:MAG: translocation/assembly module TamB, partial [Gemmatimonadales bacterium]|nr:translocation/assembly module TamB [Gemmatimonadales bacterium]